MWHTGVNSQTTTPLAKRVGIRDSSLSTNEHFIWKSAGNTYGNMQLADDIEALHKLLAKVYNIREPHLRAAQDAVIASTNSRSPEYELRDAAAQLELAFHVYEGALNKTCRTTFLFVFTDERYMIENRESAYNSLAYLAALNAIIHSFLCDLYLSDYWTQLAIDLFKQYIANTELSPKRLHEIDHRYATVEEVREYHLGHLDDPTLCSVTLNRKLTPLGEAYIQHFRQNSCLEFLGNIEKRRIYSRK